MTWSRLGGVVVVSLAVLGCKSKKTEDFELICNVHDHAKIGEEQAFLEARMKSPEGKQFVKSFYAMDGCKRGLELQGAAWEAGVRDCPLRHTYGECSSPGGM